MTNNSTEVLFCNHPTTNILDMSKETDTPRTDAMPSNKSMLTAQSDPVELYQQLCKLTVDFGKALDACVEYRKQLAASKAEVEELQQQKRNCIEIIDDDAIEKSELKAEVERLTSRMKEAEDLIKGLHEGWKKARKAHLETCKNAQTEIDKLYTQNVCLQELIQDFYEWSRRDYPTEQEVREIMNRYYNLLNKK